MRTTWDFDLEVTAWRSTGLGSIDGFETGLEDVEVADLDGIDPEIGNLRGERKASDGGAARRAIGSNCGDGDVMGRKCDRSGAWEVQVQVFGETCRIVINSDEDDGSGCDEEQKSGWERALYTEDQADALFGGVTQVTEVDGRCKRSSDRTGRHDNMRTSCRAGEGA